MEFISHCRVFWSSKNRLQSFWAQILTLRVLSGKSNMNTCKEIVWGHYIKKGYLDWCIWEIRQSRIKVGNLILFNVVFLWEVLLRITRIKLNGEELGHTSK